MTRWAGYGTQSQPWCRGYDWARTGQELDCADAAEALGYDIDSPAMQDFLRGVGFAQEEQIAPGMICDAMSAQSLRKQTAENGQEVSAQGIEAAAAGETTKIGSTEGESPVGLPMRPETIVDAPNPQEKM